MPVRPDIYDHGVDFRDLAKQDPEFSKRLTANGHLNFSDPESVRQLTKSLLRRDFGLEVKLAEDRLCPPVPNRFNYILFVQRLLDSTSPDFNDNHDPDRQVLGLDIGTGSSAIYPLLSLRQHPNWTFLATELDPQNHALATHNIDINHLSSKIHLLPLHLTSADRLLPPLSTLGCSEKVDVQLTNPPFYSSASSLQDSAKLKSRPPNSSCTGAEVEMIYADGGEVGFVKKLIEESRPNEMREKIQWFSAMLGKLESLARIVCILKEVDCTNYVLAEFVNAKDGARGKAKSRTRRWCIAWSWWTYRPSNEVARGISAKVAAEKGVTLPYKTEDIILVSPNGEEANGKLASVVNESILSLKLDGMEWFWDPLTRKGQGRSKEGDIWSRKARRKRTRRGDDDDDGVMEMIENGEKTRDPCFSFRIEIIEDHEVEKMKIRWLQGRDYIVFESFCGWLRRKISEFPS